MFCYLSGAKDLLTSGMHPDDTVAAGAGPPFLSTCCGSAELLGLLNPAERGLEHLFSLA
jgi:hypothetical protein